MSKIVKKVTLKTEIFSSFQRFPDVSSVDSNPPVYHKTQAECPSSGQLWPKMQDNVFWRPWFFVGFINSFYSQNYQKWNLFELSNMKISQYTVYLMNRYLSCPKSCNIVWIWDPIWRKNFFWNFKFWLIVCDKNGHNFSPLGIHNIIDTILESRDIGQNENH